MFPQFFPEDTNALAGTFELSFSFFHKLNRALFASAHSSGLHFRRIALLFAVGHSERPSQTELADKVGIDPSTLSPMIRDLEKEGLLIRQRDQKDARTMFVTLTDEGRHQLEQARSGLEALLERTFGRLSQEELSHYQSSVSVLSGYFDEVLASIPGADRCPPPPHHHHHRHHLPHP